MASLRLASRDLDLGFRDFEISLGQLDLGLGLGELGRRGFDSGLGRHDRGERRLVFIKLLVLEPHLCGPPFDEVRDAPIFLLAVFAPGDLLIVNRPGLVLFGLGRQHGRVGCVDARLGLHDGLPGVFQFGIGLQHGDVALGIVDLREQLSLLDRGATIDE